MQCTNNDTSCPAVLLRVAVCGQAPYSRAVPRYRRQARWCIEATVVVSLSSHNGFLLHRCPPAALSGSRSNVSLYVSSFTKDNAAIVRRAQRAQSNIQARLRLENWTLWLFVESLRPTTSSQPTTAIIKILAIASGTLNSSLTKLDSIDPSYLSTDESNIMANPSNQVIGQMTADELSEFMNDDQFGGFLPVPMDFDANMNQSFAPQVPAPATFGMPPMPQPPTANLSMGPSFHPAVGWYYPAIQAAPLQPAFQMPPAFDALGISSLTPSAMPSGASTPNAPPASALRKTRPDRKRKYGPSAFFDEQAKKRGQMARSTSPTEITYSSKAKERDDRAMAALHPKKKLDARRKKDMPAIVQPCVCNDKGQTKIKRPRNAFIIYRSAKAQQIMTEQNSTDNQNVSKLAGEYWKKETEEVREYYAGLARQEAARHKAKYPHYTYQPGLSHRNKFGSASCTCGAYQANMAALGAEADEPEFDFEAAFEIPGGYALVQQQQRPAPAAPMVAESSRTAPRPTRSRPNINYFEPEDDIFADDLFNDIGTSAEPPRKKRRPSPINTFRTSLTGAAAALAKTPSPIAFPHGGSPAQNTRSKSRASEELEAALADGNFDFNLDDTIDWDLFGGDFDMGENIDVAGPSRRRSSSNRSRTRTSPRSGKSTASPTRLYGLRSRGAA